MDKETYIRAVLETSFAGFKDEIIDNAVKIIMGYRQPHGHWKSYLPEDPKWECSECKCSFELPYCYCPHCGAKMFVEEDDD